MTNTNAERLAAMPEIPRHLTEAELVRRGVKTTEEQTRPLTGIQKALTIVATLDTAEHLQADADFAFGTRRDWYQKGSDYALAHLPGGDSPSVARLRVAVIMLAGITDEAIRGRIIGAAGPWANLSLTLDAIEDGTL